MTRRALHTLLLIPAVALTAVACAPASSVLEGIVSRALVEDQRPIELDKAVDGTWVIDAGTLAPEAAADYLEVGDEWL